MTFKDWFKSYRFRMKAFIWYLFAESFRQTKEVFYIMSKLLRALNKTMTWAYVALIVSIVSLLFGKRYVAAAFILFLLLCILMHEWETGHFLYVYRNNKMAKLKEEEQKNGEPNK